MKLLIDANLSYRLVKKINRIFPDSLHVERTGLPIPASDIEIFRWAKANGCVLLLTRDDDFVELLEREGPPPKIVMLRISNRSSDYVAALLDRHIGDVFDLVHDEEQGILEIFEP